MSIPMMWYFLMSRIYGLYMRLVRVRGIPLCFSAGPLEVALRAGLLRRPLINEGLTPWLRRPSDCLEGLS